MSDDLLIPGLQPKTGLGHPDPNHPSNKYKGGDATLYDYEGRPIVSKGRWGGQGTNLWLFMAVSRDSVGIRAPADGFRETQVCRENIGGVHFTLGASEGRPVFLSRVFGAALELPGDLDKDELKKTYCIDWLKDTTLECLTEATASMGFTGLPSPDTFAKWLEESADKTIRRMGL
jgi:hypothetical protein